MSTLGIVAARAACGPSRRSSMVQIGPVWTYQVRKRVTGRTTKPVAAVSPRLDGLEDEQPGPEVAPLVGLVAIGTERQADAHQLVAAALPGVGADERIVDVRPAA